MVPAFHCLLGSADSCQGRLTFELEYFAEGETANPELYLELSDRRPIRIFHVRPRDAARVQFVDPGTYLARAVAPMYGMPRWALSKVPPDERDRRPSVPL